MDEIQRAKRDAILYTVGFCIGIATLVIDTIPIIAIGAIIFCPYYAVKSLKKYRKLTRLQFERSKPLGSSFTPEPFHL